MKRRDFLTYASMVSAGFTLRKAERWFPQSTAPDGWRNFEVTTRVEVLKPSGVTRIWIPTALIGNTPFQRTIENTYNADGGNVQRISTAPQAMGVIAAEFPDGAKPVLVVKSRVATKNYAVDLSAPRNADQAIPADVKYFLEPTKLLPTDGIVKATATKSPAARKPTWTKRARSTSGSSRTPFAIRRRAAAAWAISVSCWNPRTWAGNAPTSTRCTLVWRARRACRRATCTASASPNRSWDTRAWAPLRRIVTKAQHCRAEVYLSGYGWVPVDPADVRKVVLEEPPGNRPLNDEMVKRARARLFGSWEMNWMAYNFAHDVALPGSSGAPIGFLHVSAGGDGRRPARQPRPGQTSNTRSRRKRLRRPTDNGH